MTGNGHRTLIDLWTHIHACILLKSSEVRVRVHVQVYPALRWGEGLALLGLLEMDLLSLEALELLELDLGEPRLQLRQLNVFSRDALIPTRNLAPFLRGRPGIDALPQSLRFLTEGTRADPVDEHQARCASSTNSKYHGP
jgi:hypothetical protein